MDREVVVIKLPEPKPIPPGVIHCPRCGGSGRNADGGVCIGPSEVRIYPASKCYLCDGHGKVRVEPYEESQ